MRGETARARAQAGRPPCEVLNSRGQGLGLGFEVCGSGFSFRNLGIEGLRLRFEVGGSAGSDFRVLGLGCTSVPKQTEGV